MFTTVFPPVLTPILLRQADIIYIYIYYIYIYQSQHTPLHYAAEGDHGKIVETLVEAKEDPCAQAGVRVLIETRLDADRGMR